MGSCCYHASQTYLQQLGASNATLESSFSRVTEVSTECDRPFPEECAVANETTSQAYLLATDVRYASYENNTDGFTLAVSGDVARHLGRPASNVVVMAVRNVDGMATFVLSIRAEN